MQLGELSGVVRADVPVDQVEAQAEALAWRCVVLDGTEIEDKAAFLEMCAGAFALPEWFGMNWDALDECLADLDLEGSGGVVVAWTAWAEFAEADAKDFAVALDVLAGAVRGWDRDGVPGAVLLLGEGPEDAVEGVASVDD